ncbi:MAG: hypothetical protein IJV98_03690 [Clostridia bacterium]|nr:hypothetical protein [Clostridia bacterium]
MKYIYILFSATPYKTGSFIRHVLHNRYNHVALSFDERLSEMYSFSRYHANAPFFAGFVKESFGRYEWRGSFSDIKVCRLSISDRKYEILKGRIERMCHHSRAYVYNYYSAAMTPLHYRVPIRNAYTCVEFVGDLVSMADVNVRQGDFHSLPGLEKACEAYVIYEGSACEYPASESWQGDAFCKKLPVKKGIAETARSFGELTRRGIEDAYGFCCSKLAELRIGAYSKHR